MIKEYNSRMRPGIGVWLFLRPSAAVLCAWIVCNIIYPQFSGLENKRWLLIYGTAVLVLFLIITVYNLKIFISELYRRNIGSAFGRICACGVVIFCFYERALIFDSVDFAEMWLSIPFYGVCIKSAPDLGPGAKFGACNLQFLSAEETRWTVYDSTDEIALPEGRQSAAWKRVARSIDAGFGICAFNTKHAYEHYYFVDFNCEENSRM